MSNPLMLYFGPWNEPGHYLFTEHGSRLGLYDGRIPWKVEERDTGLQPGRVWKHDRWMLEGPQNEGEALLHHKDGWTALSFWDRSVDTRGNSNSSYLAEGLYTFAQMVSMASKRFSVRWNKMTFAVALLKSAEDVRDQTRGLYGKFYIERIDGASGIGKKHHECAYFVLDLSHDPHAAPALRAYAASCVQEFPNLAEDLRRKADELKPEKQ